MVLAVASARVLVAVGSVFVLISASLADVAVASLAVSFHRCPSAATFAFPVAVVIACSAVAGPAFLGASGCPSVPSCRFADLHFQRDHWLVAKVGVDWTAPGLA